MASQVPLAALRKTLGAFLTGVTVVTAVDEAGRPRGMTANSFTSVSLDPPLVLVCVDRSAASCAAFCAAPGYAVHILGEHQRELAVKFASKDPDKFADLDERIGVGGAPILPGVLGWLDCVTEQVVDAGDHVILIGRVVEFGHRDDRPLGYHQGKFVTFDPALDVQNLRLAGSLCVGWVAETDDGRVALERHSDGSLGIPLRSTSTRELTDDALAARAQRAIGMPVVPQFLYSVYPRDGAGDLALVYRAVIEPGGSSEPAAGIELHSRETVPWPDIRDGSEHAVVRRYFRERTARGFGIYAGTEARGTVAMVASPYLTPPDATDSVDVSGPDWRHG